MPNVTISVPEELHREMRRHGTVKWPEVMRRAIQAELARMHTLDRLLAGSRLTEDDALKLGRQARRHAADKSREDR